jgi:threonine dehydratase
MREIPIEAVRDAGRHIYDLVIRTPLIRLELPADSPVAAAGGSVFLKLETLQPIGSFKLRGAHNVIRQLTRAQLANGVWTVSAGNAALGVAMAARHAGARCAVMVSDTAPAVKVDAIRRLGATVVPASYDECWRTVEAHGSARMQGHFVHPFDDDQFMAGNGTIALEILEDLPNVDVVIGSVGGGGLLGGVGSAFRALRPDIRIMAAEPETAAPLATSLRNGEASAFAGWQASFVDGAGGKSVLPTMWPVLSRVVSESIVVSLDEARAAMTLVADRCHVIMEGAAACAVAAALSGRVHGTIVAIASGGNIDLAKFATLTGASIGSTA